MGLSARLEEGQFDAAFSDYYRFAEQRMERAALEATDKARRIALSQVRGQMQGSGLGRLGQGITSTSDLERGRGVHRTPGGGFSASGIVYVRSTSERTRGAIEAYTRGASIKPRRGRWLWIPTKEIPRVTNRYRMTPDLWRRNGFDRKIGPLVLIRSVNGYPLLVVRNVGVSLAGKPRSARSLTKSGRPRKGQTAKSFLVAFIGIPYTSRAARVDISAIMRSVQDQLPQLFANALGRI